QTLGESSSGTFTVRGGGASVAFGLGAGSNYFRLPADGSVEAALQTDLTAEPSGVYAYRLSTGLMRFVQGHYVGHLSTQSMPVVSANEIDIPFGSGWGLDGLQQIVENADGSVLLIDGGGTSLLFQPPATADGPFVSPSGDFSTLVKLQGGTFQRTLKDQ